MGSARIAVVGTGANGASIGADMTRAGLDVTFIDQWPAHVKPDGLVLGVQNGMTMHDAASIVGRSAHTWRCD